MTGKVGWVYLVTELAMSGDDRDEVHAVFTELHMAMALFNSLVEKMSGRCRYYTGGDVCRVEPEDGKGSAYAVTHHALIPAPDHVIKQVGP